MNQWNKVYINFLLFSHVINNVAYNALNYCQLPNPVFVFAFNNVAFNLIILLLQFYFDKTNDRV